MATHKIVLTREEMENIVRGYFDARPDTVVEIEDKDNEVHWIDIYPNWRGGRPPHADQFKLIDVMFRNGTIDRAHPSYWGSVCWNQDGSPYDIVKYRPVK